MSITIRGDADEALANVRDSLLDYERQHPHAQIDIYRRNAISIRVRVIDPSFAGLGKPDRHDRIWEYLEKLPGEIPSDISMVVLLTPDEVPKSMGNMEFEDPTPSLIQ